MTEPTPRFRFAPSPTGYLHLGGARTALFNWLAARRLGGRFLLRIEDTDQDRNTPESVQAILEGMAWLGMHPDEPVVTQSEGVARHRQAAMRLVDEGHAYRCYCTPEEIDAMRERAMAEGGKPRYDGTWRDRTDWPTDGRPFAIRLRTPLTGTVGFDDMVLGPVEVDNGELDDLVILRSDGWPTYNFVVVCDDGHMGITHVVRGQDHVNNTFRQIHIYRALDLPLPRFAHLPMIEGLSKRKGSASVMAYRDLGYHPEAILSYLARLGWSHGDQEVFTVDELRGLFDLTQVNRASGKFDDVKLAWMNHEFMRLLPVPVVADRLQWQLTRELGLGEVAADRLRLLVEALRDRAPTLVEMVDKARFAFEAPAAYDPKAVAKHLQAAWLPAYDALIDALAGLTPWEPGAIEATLTEVLARLEVPLGKVAQPIRIALTGGTVSPPIHQTLGACVQDDALTRLRALRPHFPAA